MLRIKWSEKNGWGTPLICQLRNFEMHPAAKVRIKKYKRQIISRVFLLRKLWTVNYYLKSLSKNLNNENIKTGVSSEMIFKK
jgi:hypothetical protein